MDTVRCQLLRADVVSHVPGRGGLGHEVPKHKPQGLTPYGWRKQQELRQALQPRQNEERPRSTHAVD